MLLVIDKSWLQSNNVETLKRLSQNYAFLLTDALLFELTTTDDSGFMMRCFGKLLDVIDACFLIENVGGLLRYEMNLNLPCSPLMNKAFLVPAQNYCEAFRNLKKGTVTSEQDKIRNVEKHERELEEVEFDKKVFASVGAWFPEIYNIKNSDESSWKTATEQIKDPAKIKVIHSEITALRPSHYPPAQQIDEKWAFYRRLQVHLIAALDYCRRYGMENTAASSSRVANFVLDLEYCIIAALADGLATRDKGLAKFYRIICPNGILIDA